MEHRPNHLGPHIWELQPDNIREVSAFIARNKILTENRYRQSTCSDCYFKRDHRIHSKPSSLYENFTQLNFAKQTVSELINQQERNKRERDLAGHASLRKFGQDEEPFEQKLRSLNDEMEANTIAYESLKADFSAGRISPAELTTQAKPIIEEGRIIERERFRTKREHLRLKEDFKRFYEGEEERYAREKNKIKSDIETARDSVVECQKMVDEDIKWYRSQGWQRAGDSSESRRR